jgi:hypothetical protein
MLYVFVVIEHGTRRLAHVNVTAHPSADSTLQQLRAVVGEESRYQYPGRPKIPVIQSQCASQQIWRRRSWVRGYLGPAT